MKRESPEYGSHYYDDLPPGKRPQDPNRDGQGLRYETLEHGGKVPDNMPQAIRVHDDQGRHATFIPECEYTDRERRPSDHFGDGRNLKFEPLEYGCEYDDDMPQRLRVSDQDGASCEYVPIKEDSKVVDSHYFERKAPERPER